MSGGQSQRRIAVKTSASAGHQHSEEPTQPFGITLAALIQQLLCAERGKENILSLQLH